MKIIKQILIVLGISIFISGCNKPVEVSLDELIKINKNFKEPKVVICYYTGSDTEYHYFLFQDLGIQQIYKVIKTEINLNEFKVTKDRQKWLVMPWGIHKKDN